ncbi:RING-H2 finger protein ATL16 [Telopea speciosissima]|uniref:RING-H2 finger protein ATL16 n=1 Tax=Telopea speciosissima TaxID=54955 RepID=UPI001CC79758|nr:RING-H2 finger protein ATL16 [Telopea speciosissima]
MDLLNRFYYKHGTQALPPSYGPPTSSSSSSSDTSFPILAIAILGITTTAILLVSYYVFVIKCCLNWHRFDLLRRFSISQARRHEDPLMVYSPAVVSRGLDEVLIRAIPIIQFKKGGENQKRDNEEMSFIDCAVCLNEFQEEEKLRVLPNCAHAFHIDCIDVWLQSNANCPLCRSSISSTTRIPYDQIIAPTSSPQDPTPFMGNSIGGDEDFVVIELRDEQSVSQTSHRRQGTGISGDLSVQSVSPSPRKLEQRIVPKKARKFHHMSSMGDECINVREKDDQFSIQPIRRSFSMDSSADRQLYLSVQEIIQQNRPLNEVSTSEGCSSRVRRSFFSFSQCRRSRNAVLPIHSEL